MAKRRTTQNSMPSEQAALLDTVIQNPDDDTVRLVYADWLQENGDEERAEFIRLQIRLAQGGPIPNPHWTEYRVAQLLKYNRTEWEGELRGPGVEKVTFERGFAATVSAHAEAYISRGGLWHQRHPLQQVHLTEVAGRVGRLAATAHLDRIRHLDLQDRDISDKDLRAWAKARRSAGVGRFKNLVSLSIAPALIRSPGLEALAGCEMPQLRGLWLFGPALGDSALKTIATPAFKSLEVFGNTGGAVGDAGLATILTSRWLTRLTDIGLPQSYVTGMGLNALADLPAGTALRELMLVGSQIAQIDDDRVRDALLKHPNLQLELQNCQIPLPTRRRFKEWFGDRVSFGALREPWSWTRWCSGWYRLRGQPRPGPRPRSWKV